MAGPNGPNARLTTWGEIGRHLGCTDKTARRWHLEAGLPVHRLPGRRVFAYAAELDAWLARAKPLPPDSALPATPASRWRVPYRSLSISAVLAILVAIYAVTRLIPGSPPPPEIAVERLFARVAAEGGAVRHVAVPKGSAFLTLNRNRDQIYVAGGASTAVHIVDAASEKITGVIPLPSQAGSLLLDRDGRYLYVGTMRSGLMRIDTATHAVVQFREGLDASLISSLFLTGDGRRLFIANVREGLKVMDLPSNRVRTLSATACPWSFAAAPNGKILYIGYRCGNLGGNPDAIDKFDLATEQSRGVLKGFPLVAGGMAVAPGDATLWANAEDACDLPYAHRDQSDCPVHPGNALHIIRPSDGLVLTTRGSSGHGAYWKPLLLPGGKQVLALAKTSLVFHAGAMRESETWCSPGDRYHDAAVDAARHRAYFVSSSGGILDIIDLPAASCDPPAAELWNHWSGDGAANDRRQALHGTAAPQTTFAPGLVGQAFDLRRGTFEVSSPSFASLVAISESPGSLVFWAKPVAPGGGTLLEFVWPDGTRRFRLTSTPDLRLQLEWDGTLRIRTAPALAADAWRQVAFVREASRLMLLVDGRLAGESAHVQAAFDKAAGARTLRLGPFPGLLDEVLLYASPLPPSDLLALDRQMRTCLLGPRQQ